LRNRHFNRLRVVLSIVGGHLEASVFLALCYVSTPLLRVDGVLELLAHDDDVLSLDVLSTHFLVEHLQSSKAHRTSVYSHLIFGCSALVLGTVCVHEGISRAYLIPVGDLNLNHSTPLESGSSHGLKLNL
jgi:hypothetical protein